MITEEYVYFEIAKLLKEKGFDDEYTNAFYDKSGILYFIDLLSDFSEHPDNDTDIAASTLYAVMKWLYKNYGIYITILQVEASTVTMEQEYFFYRIQKNRRNVGVFTEKFKEPEQAANSAIKYVLENLI